MNIEADKLATSGLDKSPVKDFNQDTDKAFILLDDKKVASHYVTHIREKYSATQLYNYYHETYNWSNNQLQSIWWEVHEKALKNFSEATKTTIKKFIHNRAACNVIEHRYYEYKSPMCHECTNILEDHNHILKCKCCPRRINLRKKFIMNLKDKLITLGTSGDLTKIIVSFTKAWLHDEKNPDIKEIVPDASIHLVKAIGEQEKLGWSQWFRGRITKSWGDLYNHDISKPNNLVKFPSANRWGKEIISLTLSFVLECWKERNLKEHEMETNPISRKKEKQIEELKWLINKNKEIVPHAIKNLNQKELIDLKKENISLMTEQVKNIVMGTS
jgi:hypothetical protein